MTRAAYALCALAIALSGCGSAPPTVQTVKVAVPVECRVDRPGRPAMPTDSLRPGADLDTAMKSALAEIDVRQAYETKLEAALDVCRRPLAAPATD